MSNVSGSAVVDAILRSVPAPAARESPAAAAHRAHPGPTAGG